MQYAYIWSGRDAYNAKQLYGCAAPVQTVACRLHAPCARRRKARKKAAAPGFAAAALFCADIMPGPSSFWRLCRYRRSPV